MEIDKAIRESDDTRLKTKYNNAIYVIQRALALYSYKLQMDISRLDFKSGLEALFKSNPIRAIFLGVRIGDPTAVGQEQFSPSSPGWPPFMRVNPILDWSYRDIWAFLLTSKVQYCSLYDQGYTSIGSIHDTVPNALLRHDKTDNNSEEEYRPAYLLPDGRLERAGRVKRFTSSLLPAVSNGSKYDDSHWKNMFTASVIAVGDEILSDLALSRIGWDSPSFDFRLFQIDSVADEVERQKPTKDMVFIYGGVGPLPSDVTVAGVAKAFGVRTAPDEEFEEYLRHLIGERCTGDRNEMAQLPEGITELLHHEKLSVPLIKCKNVIILTATNVAELENEWDCLTELMGPNNGLLAIAEPLEILLLGKLSSSKASVPYLLLVMAENLNEPLDDASLANRYQQVRKPEVSMVDPVEDVSTLTYEDVERFKI
ncbi:probable fad synthase [Phtheirospermum japonicum]|uniref:FAD synthase n=1 Tax=Phtheirospermum japonicum TaxID=374723 RepID=A0A830BXU9_9LAMI|nr:probable fad synthase [Phtheirospermum japonicum]